MPYARCHRRAPTFASKVAAHRRSIPTVRLWVSGRKRSSKSGAEVRTAKLEGSCPGEQGPSFFARPVPLEQPSLSCRGADILFGYVEQAFLPAKVAGRQNVCPTGRAT